MHRAYDDIISRLGPPLWFDGNAVPRYVPFSPEQCGIYVDYVALLEVACQACGHRFKVASEISEINYGDGPEPPVRYPHPADDPWDAAGSFEYGDPPNTRCCLAGPTMNCVPIRVIEFWTRTDLNGVFHCDWRRVSEHEIEMPSL